MCVCMFSFHLFWFAGGMERGDVLDGRSSPLSMNFHRDEFGKVNGDSWMLARGRMRAIL